MCRGLVWNPWNHPIGINWIPYVPVNQVKALSWDSFSSLKLGLEKANIGLVWDLDFVRSSQECLNRHVYDPPARWSPPTTNIWLSPGGRHMTVRISIGFRGGKAWNILEWGLEKIAQLQNVFVKERQLCKVLEVMESWVMVSFWWNWRDISSWKVHNITHTHELRMT